MKALVTGACGFIGFHLCRRLLADGWEVAGIDNLSRPGSELHKRALAKAGADIFQADVSSMTQTVSAFLASGHLDAVFHLAAQVAVTASYKDLQDDFQTNAAGTFNTIDCVRRYAPKAWCLYASTNKVYGCVNSPTPVSVFASADPYTPYGVSKYTGELYWREYGRKEIGLTTCALRQSCIYGPNQYGVEDQGWLAWFAIANVLGLPLTIYGDGMQGRDLLHVSDLVDLYLECFAKRVSGAFPVGGGYRNVMTLQSALGAIVARSGRQFESVSYEDVRPGDQKYFVADNGWTKSLGLDWTPQVGVEEGLTKLVNWTQAHQRDIQRVRRAEWI